MKKGLCSFCLFICFLLLCQPVFGQPAIEWQHSYGGGNNQQNFSVIQTSDGGYITTGLSNSVNGDVTGNHGNGDCWIVKTDAGGAIEWEKSYGGSGNDLAFNVLEVPGGYVIDGYKYSVDGDVACQGNYWLFKIDLGGTLLWQQCLNISLGNRADFPSLIRTSDGGFAMATGAYNNWSGCHGSFDMLLVKMDSMGNVLWHQCYGGSMNDYSSCVRQTPDGGYIIAGYTQSTDGEVSGTHINTSSGRNYDYYIVKTDNMGNYLWSKTYGGYNEDVPYSIENTSDSGYIVGGYTYSNDGDVHSLRGTSDCWILKLDHSGALQWSKSLGGTCGDNAQSVIQIADGNYIVAGTTCSNDWDVSGNHGNNDYWIVKLNDTGSIIWQECLGGSKFENAMCIRQTTDNGFIISGNSRSDDSEVTGNHGNTDYWLVKLYPEVLPLRPRAATRIFPNPSAGTLFIQYSTAIRDIQIRDKMGRLVLSGSYSDEQHEKSVDVSTLPQGMYIVHINGSGVAKFSRQ